jgi:multiple sugar transport system ATP-binding protein
MAQVVIENLTKSYPEKNGPGVAAVNSVNLTIKDREFMVLVGPSGCGKSTTLRMIAGLEEITAGTVSIDGRVVNDVLPKDRDIAMVFQNYALYPHMSVYENMAFGLKLRNFPKNEIETRVREGATLLGLGELLDRKPKALSGGQRQRVAVGRAIVRQPKVFLFDEPLSNLDAKSRVSTRAEISKLHARLGATMIYVTHDQIEAMTMGDRICVMKDGQIMQVDEPLALYNRPANLFVAGFIGSPAMNFFHGSLRRRNGEMYFDLECSAAGKISLALPRAAAAHLHPHSGKSVVVGIRPENIRVTDRATPGTAIVARLEIAEPMGAETYLHLHAHSMSFIARVAPTGNYEPDQVVGISFDSAQLHFFDASTGDAMR